VVKGLAKIFAMQPQNEGERERVLKAASACVTWESSASRLKGDESSQSQPNQKYALMATAEMLPTLPIPANPRSGQRRMAAISSRSSGVVPARTTSSAALRCKRGLLAVIS
jgi:hypothetical protein